MSSQRFLVIWPLLSFETGAATISCPVTLEGSFHSATVAKISGSLLGNTTNATIRGGRAECNETGTARVLSETLPWHIRYDRFIGALPNITEIRLQLVGARFMIRTNGGLECLAGSTARDPAMGYVVRDAGGIARRVRADEGATLPLGGGFLCEIAGNANYRGTAEVFVQVSTTRIVVTLVQ
jgi:hypothetical protein